MSLTIGIAETLDYTLTWTDELDGDTISTSAWVVGTGLTSVATSNTTTTTSIFVSSGDESKSPVTLTNTVVTAGGRTLVRDIQITVVRRRSA